MRVRIYPGIRKRTAYTGLAVHQMVIIKTAFGEQATGLDSSKISIMGANPYLSFGIIAKVVLGNPTRVP